MFTGISLALIEVSLIFLLGFKIKCLPKFKKIDTISYYWLLFTSITGIWELSFLINYNLTCNEAHKLLKNNEHVWTNNYSLINIIPNKFSILFYSEYGAYADREYMKLNDNWSRIIEGSHLIFCGLGSLLSLIFYKSKNQMNHFYKNKEFEYQETINYYSLIFVSSSMSSQAMNSILYMVNYFHQTHDSLNPNYNTTEFPIGLFFNKRPFMYVNILWTIMPLYVLRTLILKKY